MTDKQANAAIAILTAQTSKDESIPTVNARDLHGALGVKTNFRDWVKRTIKALGLVEGVDFIRPDLRPDLSVNTGRGRRAKEYHLTLSAAQRIAVSGNTDTGKAIWDYLKEVEAIAKREAAELSALAAKRMIARVTGKPVNLTMNASLERHRHALGKPCRSTTFSNEASMLDTIVLGMHPKKWKEQNGIAPADSVRNHMSAEQLELLAHLEDNNAKMMDWGVCGLCEEGQPLTGPAPVLDYESRKLIAERAADSWRGQRALIAKLLAAKG